MGDDVDPASELAGCAGPFVWDWGLDEAAHLSPAVPLPHVDAPPDQLPEIVALSAEGWVLAPDAPGWVMLPAIWPRSHRTWVPDRSVRYVLVGCSGQEPTPREMTHAEKAELESDYDVTADHYGVPGRPAGRLWLLRTPSSWTLDGVLSTLEEAAERAGVDRGPTPQDASRFVAVLVRELRLLFGSAPQRP